MSDSKEKRIDKLLKRLGKLTNELEIIEKQAGKVMDKHGSFGGSPLNRSERRRLARLDKKSQELIKKYNQIEKEGETIKRELEVLESE